MKNTYGVNVMLVSSSEAFPRVCSLNSSENMIGNVETLGAKKSVPSILSPRY